MEKSRLLSAADIKTEAISDDNEGDLSNVIESGTLHESTAGENYHTSATSDHLYLPEEKANVLNSVKVEPGVIFLNLHSNSSLGATCNVSTESRPSLCLPPVGLQGQDVDKPSPPVQSHLGGVSKIPEKNNISEHSYSLKNASRSGRSEGGECSNLLSDGQKHPMNAGRTDDRNLTNIQSYLPSQTVGKSYSCQFCTQQFEKSCDLEQHQLIHTYSKPFKCSVCNMGFSFSSQLEAHMRTHSGGKVKPWKCHTCGIGFKYPSNLHNHVLKHRGPSGAKPYGCKFCFKHFSTEYSVKKHEMIRTCTKAFMCDICGMDFNFLLNYKMHIRKHMDYKPESVSGNTCDADQTK